MADELDSCSVWIRPYSQKDISDAKPFQIRKRVNGEVLPKARAHIVVEFHEAMSSSLAARIHDAADRRVLMTRADAKVKDATVTEIAAYYSINKATLYRWLSSKDLETKKRSGRPRQVQPKMERRIVDIRNSKNGQSVRAVSATLAGESVSNQTRASSFSTTYRGKIRLSPSTSSCQSVLAKGKRYSIKRRPQLTKENKKVRYDFAVEQMSLSDEERNDHVVAIDEAWISTAKSGTGTIIQHPSGSRIEAKLVNEVKSKRHATKIMVIACVARPRMLNRDSAGSQGDGEKAEFCKFQNGKVAIVRCVAQEAYKRDVTKMINGEKVVLHKKGDPKVVSVTIDSRRYKDFLDREGGVFEKIRDYFGEGIVVKFQEDGAPGHGYNNKKNRSPTAVHDELDKVAQDMDIKMFKQPHNSPELNPLDLGIWHSIQSKVKHMTIPQGKFDDSYVESLIWDCVKQAWDDLEPRTIWNCWMVKDEVLKLLVKNKGGPIGREPHSKIRSFWGTGE